MPVSAATTLLYSLGVFLNLICLSRADHTTAVNCAVSVTVEEGDVSNEAPSLSLQEVLLNVSRGEINSSDCLDILITSGRYIITEFIYIDGQNLTLRGGDNVSISFNFSGKFDPRRTSRAYYVFSIFNANRVQLIGLNFVDSPGIITITNTSTAVVQNCSFRYFFQGALDLYNCEYVEVSRCMFEHNGPTSVIKEDRFRGHAGGLSVGYHKIPTSPVAHITDCLFRNNTSDPTSDLVQTTSDLVRSSQFTGRGGGCAFPVNPLYSLNATVQDCTFLENSANSFGGGLYVAFNGKESHLFTIQRLFFLRNHAPTAGALEVGFITGGIPGADNRFEAYDSVFVENESMFGGGVYFFSLGDSVDSQGQFGNFASFENCTFLRNSAEDVGAAIGVATLLYFRDLSNITPFQITNCNFSFNDDGALSVAYFPLAFSGSTVFQENRGRSMVVVASRVDVDGAMEFVENNGAGIDGGALYLTSLSQLVLSPGANLTFTNNTGVIGAAIVGDTVFVPSVVSKVAFNPLCLIRYINGEVPPDEWENVSLSFSGNAAVTSSAVLLTNLDLCSYVRQGIPWFNSSRTFRWNFVHYSNDNQNSAHVPDQYNSLWYVQTPAEQISVTTINNEAFPGEVFQLGLEALDEIGRTSSAIIRISDDDDDNGDYLFDPAVITFNSIALGAINTSFYKRTRISSSKNNLTVNLVFGESSLSGSFHMTSLECPPGYVLSPAPQEMDYETCSCNSNNDLILQCEGRSILIETGYWGMLSTHSEDRLFLYPCPYGYCRCEIRNMGGAPECINEFNSSDLDRQCICDRRGELCGECKYGKGVSALLNKCTTCSDASGLLILLLMVLDAGVFVFLLLLMKPFPAWVFPFVFYLQIMPYLAAEGFPITFGKLHPYLYYISSGLSFYFIYDFCLYSNMSPLVSYFLRYLPLFILTIIATAVLSIRRYLKKHALSWHGLWWIVLLMYTHLLHTSMSILNCPILPDQDSYYTPRWYIDGRVKCFNGGHAALGLLAIFILGLCIAIIPLSLLYIFKVLHRPWVLRRSVEPLILPFKEELKWWSNVELGRRIIIVLFVVSFPQNLYPAIFVLMITAAVYGYIQPFKQSSVNALEVALSINTLVLLLLRNTDDIEDSLGVLTEQSQHNETSNGCRDTVQGVTNFSWVLFHVYYLPLLAFCVLGTIAAFFALRKLYTKWRSGEVSEEADSEEHPRLAQTKTTTDIMVNFESSGACEVVTISYQRR